MRGGRKGGRKGGRNGVGGKRRTEEQKGTLYAISTIRIDKLECFNVTGNICISLRGGKSPVVVVESHTCSSKHKVDLQPQYSKSLKLNEARTFTLCKQ